MASRVVTVLTPNGRRQNVKITLDTTLLQVLEEVCQKHGLKPEEYDLKHHKKVLDTSAVFRYSGLPNNAFLEMVEAVKIRQESSVTLVLHLESGDRISGEFSPTSTLLDIIKKLKPDEALDDLVVVYMRKEISGNDDLMKTTLRDLGLTGGRAMLRILHKKADEPKSQANVTKPLKHMQIKTESPPAKKKIERTPSPVKKIEETELKIKLEEKDIPSEVYKTEKKKSPDLIKKIIVEKKALEAEKKKPEDGKKSLGAIKKSPLMERKDNVEVAGTSTAGTSVDRMKDDKMSKENAANYDQSQTLPEAILLGDRQAVAYSVDTIKPITYDDLPDDFFELTVNDAKLLMKEVKTQMTEMENAPLMTAAQRELEENKRMLNLLNKNRRTVLRIKFPDQTVLQGTFSPVESISKVEDFVRQYLDDPSMPFDLYTTPPKVILKPEQRLLECNCVPCAVLYFGVKSENSSSKFLRANIFDKMSTLDAASRTALQSRGYNVTVQSDSEQPSTSAASKQADHMTSPPNKIPKWFKTGK